MICCIDETACWVDNVAHDEPTFAGLVQIYTEKIVTTLKANAMVAHSLHVVLLNFEKGF